MFHLKRRAKAILADAIDLVIWRFGYHVTAMVTSDLPGIDDFWVRRWPAYLGRRNRPKRLRARKVTDQLVDGPDAALVTAGMDVSDHRMEIEVVGWGRDGKQWPLAHHVIDEGARGARLEPRG